ncbi:hypothetical protein GPALN_011730, partial [Globodera pallida]
RRHFWASHFLTLWARRPNTPTVSLSYKSPLFLPLPLNPCGDTSFAHQRNSVDGVRERRGHERQRSRGGCAAAAAAATATPPGKRNLLRWKNESEKHNEAPRRCVEKGEIREKRAEISKV